MNRGHGPRVRIGQQNRKTVGSTNRDRDARLAGEQRVSFSHAAGSVGRQRYIGVNLLQARHRGLIEVRVTCPEAMLQPIEALQKAGSEDAHRIN